EMLVKFNGKTLGKDFTHLPPLVDNDGGHGMIFSDGKKSYLTYHTPNKSGSEHPFYVEIEFGEDFIRLK
ncbi:MAG: glycoside hydrolase, partial [Clostridia bacterium]|nr:glycoside hydrolase [Clostridia bacterium]